MKRSGGKVHEPSTADLGKWRRLARVAALAARVPPADGSIADLAGCAKRAGKAVVIGVLSDDNACIRLILGAKAYVALPPERRAETAAALVHLADQVAALLGGPAAARREPIKLPYRADIDG